MAKAKSTKLYRVHIGMFGRDGQEMPNWTSKNVLAKDAGEAISKARLGKNSYPESVELIASDVI